MRWVLTTPRFNKRLTRFIHRHPELSGEVRLTMERIAKDPRAPSLRTHRLHGDLSDYSAAQVSREYRLVFALEPGTVIFLDIGTHDDVYR